MHAPVEHTTERDPRWARVVARDASADGAFVYSVESTGIYCRPSCPARRANPRNVRFHASATEAEAAGFRPCRRCKPDQKGPAQQHATMIGAACRTIEAADDTPRLAELAKQAGVSPFHFHRIFRAVTGMTPRAYAMAVRARKVRETLERSDTVTAAIYDAGFNSNGRFYEQADSILGMTPRDYRAGGTHAEIRFAIGECSLGAILVARSEKGICAILLGDEPEALLRELQDRFPRATLIGDDAGFEELVARVVGFVETPAQGLDLPLDVRGTAFQHRVWQALRDIPPGTTTTYTELARQIGAPKAVRAVAGACAANPVAVAIPCHRVVRTDGGLAGYRWGIDRKRALLDRERR